MEEENNLNSGLLSASASFRELYYGAVAGAVPFEWESRPGTPKNDRAAASSAVDPDPLTPPPCYYGALGMGKRETGSKYSSRSGRLIHAVVLLILRRFRRPASSSSVNSNSRSSSFSSFSFSSFSSCKWNKEDNSMD
ncbi:uncharacterized protein LOC141842166 [Curcuma longa]|uniref:uncharacterized protein LOC141842166 n=1 Tax=Curcuma longa TaxID=136217 RepID=UPI003D9EAE9C